MQNRTVSPSAHPPASRRPDFDISAVLIGGEKLPVTETAVLETPFARLLRFARPGADRLPPLALAAPLSSNFAYLLRDAVLGMLPHADVYVLEWRDGRDVPAEWGEFGLDENIDGVVQALQALPPGAHLLGLCQSVVPCFAAAALLEQANDAARPASLILMAGPVDPRIRPTRVAQLIRAQSLDVLAACATTPVPAAWAGSGRLVYSSEAQRPGLMAHLARHLATGGELRRKTLHDDGADPFRHPFMKHYLALMDLPAGVFLDTMRLVFHEAALPQGRLRWRGVRVEGGALERTALLTVEGEEDDIAAVGQTAAAHDLAPRLPAGRRGRHVEPGVGHFGVFHGAAWRNHIVPVISRFIADHAASA